MITMKEMTMSIMHHVDRYHFIANNTGYSTKHHPLYPDSDWNNDIAPALNIIPKGIFDRLMEENEYWQVHKIGELDFWEDYVDFFGSFGSTDKVFTKMSMEELESYDLPKCFLNTVRTFTNHKDNKWDHYSLGSGDARTTVIVVIDRGSNVELYRRRY